MIDGQAICHTCDVDRRGWLGRARGWWTRAGPL